MDVLCRQHMSINNLMLQKHKQNQIIIKNIYVSTKWRLGDKNDVMTENGCMRSFVWLTYT